MFWDRVVMYQEALKLIGDVSKLNVLDISPDKNSFWQSVGFGSYDSVSFPYFDVCRTDDAGNVDDINNPSFDLVVMDQVLEHVRDPMVALDTAWKLLKTGGRVFVATPFLVKYHPSPIDCWRWTETGMRRMLEDSYSSVRIGQWGNKQCVVANFDKWTEYRAGLSLVNEPEFPCQVWGIGTKK